jgi:hypothetical protein
MANRKYGENRRHESDRDQYQVKKATMSTPKMPEAPAGPRV